MKAALRLAAALLLAVGGLAQAAAPDVPARITGLSTRLNVRTGDDEGIAGFVIAGTARKRVAIRVRGPSLAGSGVANVLADPMFTVVRSGLGPVTGNDNWQSAASAPLVSASGYAPSDPLESAVLVTLDGGPYTALVQGAGNGTGVAIIEVFEVDTDDSPLTGISTRGRVGVGDDVMIGGFIVSGTTPQTVVVRARGPSLAAQNVTGVLNDPVLQLVSAADGSVITNDDWQSAPNAAALQASGFAPSDARESALLVTLNPGAYTAIVSGQGSRPTGVAIIEIFPQ